MSSRPLQRVHTWHIVLPLAIVLGLAVAAAVWLSPGAAEGWRAAIRLTGRTSFVLFSTAFAASALYRRWPAAWSRWLLLRRRAWGLGFAVSHGLHALAIFMFSRADAELFHVLVNPAMLVLGGLGYAFIVAMAATSHDAAQRWLGRRWRQLHLVGSYYIAVAFLNTFAKNALVAPGYWVGVIVLGAVIVLRFMGRSRREAGDTAAPRATARQVPR